MALKVGDLGGQSMGLLLQKDPRLASLSLKSNHISARAAFVEAYRIPFSELGKLEMMHPSWLLEEDSVLPYCPHSQFMIVLSLQSD